MEKILVTGGAGFIGTNLLAALLDRTDAEVICLDNFDRFYSRTLKMDNIASFIRRENFRFVEGDICNPVDIRRLPRVDIIIHLAAMAGVRQSFRDPALYNAVNVTGTTNLLEFARRKKVTQFLYASSSSIYGDNGMGQPMSEDLMPDLRSPYAVSKYLSELTGRQYSGRWDIRFLSLRFFSVYGPGQRPDQIISTLFRCAADGRPVILSGKGRSTRDYTFVDDIVDGIIAALSYRQSAFEIFNLGSGQQVCLNDLLHAVEDIAGKKIRTSYARRHPADALHTCADITKAAGLLHYQPRISLPEGLRYTFSTLASPSQPATKAEDGHV